MKHFNSKGEMCGKFIPHISLNKIIVSEMNQNAQ